MKSPHCHYMVNDNFSARRARPSSTASSENSFHNPLRSELARLTICTVANRNSVINTNLYMVMSTMSIESLDFCVQFSVDRLGRLKIMHARNDIYGTCSYNQLICSLAFGLPTKLLHNRQVPVNVWTKIKEEREYNSFMLIMLSLELKTSCRHTFNMYNNISLNFQFIIWW